MADPASLTWTPIALAASPKMIPSPSTSQGDIRNSFSHLHLEGIGQALETFFHVGELLGRLDQKLRRLVCDRSSGSSPDDRRQPLG